MRYKMIFSYDGTNFYGYQKQPQKRTIEEEIEKILTRINGNDKVTLHASGRTDAGVHALNQCAHFDLTKEINTNRLKHSINKLLPDDIYIKSIENVSDNFHARFDVINKTYIYKINTLEYNPIEKNYIYQYNRPLDIKKLNEALEIIKGTHNFKAFAKQPNSKDDNIRTIFEARATMENGIITISLNGTGFMRYMVRNIVGTIVEYAEVKITLEEIRNLFKNKDRTKAGKCAKACGLYLKEVNYK